MFRYLFLLFLILQSCSTPEEQAPPIEAEVVFEVTVDTIPCKNIEDFIEVDYFRNNREIDSFPLERFFTLEINFKDSLQHLFHKIDFEIGTSNSILYCIKEKIAVNKFKLYFDTIGDYEHPSLIAGGIEHWISLKGQNVIFERESIVNDSLIYEYDSIYRIEKWRPITYSNDSFDDAFEYDMIVEEPDQTYTETEFEDVDKPNFLIIFIIFSPFWFPAVFFIYQRWKIRDWRKGMFPADLKYNKHNLAEAYICLSTYFIVIDKFHQMNKIATIKQFFSQRLKYIPEHFDDIVDRNFHHPIHPESVLDWINKYANNSHKKLLAQFLVSLCHVDGAINQKEYDGLRFVVQKLKLGIPFLESTIAMHRKGNTNNSSSSSSSSSGSGRISSQPTPSKRSKFATILSVTENADETEIRKRYRQLAKQYHPDKFARESKEKQDQAHQRFLEIQEAYEYLLSHVKVK